MAALPGSQGSFCSLLKQVGVGVLPWGLEAGQGVSGPTELGRLMQ